MRPSSIEALRVVIRDGCLHFVWDDRLAALTKLGEARTTRASNVEPSPDGTGWCVDLTPVGGPILPTTYALRAAALRAERRWLRQHLGL